jgi:hypothetical protein
MERNTDRYLPGIRLFLLVPFLILVQIPLFAAPQPSQKNISAVTSSDASEVKKVGGYPFYIYKDAYSKINHFYPSGWMGDYDDMTYNNAWKLNPKSGHTCFRIKYSAKGKRGYGWAGICWQDPMNNWNVGKLIGGYNLTGARKLRFYARGEKGGEIVEFQTGGMSTGKQTTGPVELKKEWALYEISVKGMDLSIVNGGFIAVYTRFDNPDGCIFYLDEIYFTDAD